MSSSKEEDKTVNEPGADQDPAPDGDAAAAGGLQDEDQPPAAGQGEEVKDGLKPTPVVYISALMTFLFLLGTYDFLTSRWDQQLSSMTKPLLLNKIITST